MKSGSFTSVLTFLNLAGGDLVISAALDAGASIVPGTAKASATLTALPQAKPSFSNRFMSGLRENNS
jgi:hypothetical protein